MATNVTYSTFTSTGGAMISQSDESAIRQQIDHLVQETDRLRQLLRDCENQEASSSEQHSYLQTRLNPQILTAESTLVNFERSAITATSVPREYFVYPEDGTEYPSTPTTASFASFPMSPLMVDEGTGSDPDIIEHRHSRFLTFLSSDGRSTPLTRPSSAPGGVDGPALFPSSPSSVSHRARASTSTPLWSPRDSWESSGGRIEYQLIIDIRKQDWFNQKYGFNRINAVKLSWGEPYTRELIPWPIDIDGTTFMDILERALDPHAEGCDPLHSPPADCQTCIARIEARGILTRVLSKTLRSGQSLFDLRDRWNPNDDWLTIAVDPRDQHFVRMGMLLVHECICSIIEQIGAPDPTIWRMSTDQAASTHSQLPRQV